jgi:hypothetical protein
MNIEKRFEDLEKRLAFLEKERGVSNAPPVLEMDLALPEADIGGLHFNETRVHAVFEEQDDGWYYSRDILFLSARNVEDDNSRDILTEYLESDAVKEAFCAYLDTDTESYFSRIKISLPQKSRGFKQYNGVNCWYWLADPSVGSEACFSFAYSSSSANSHIASAVGGCAPAFRVVRGGKQ